MASDAVSSIRTVASFCAEQKVIDTYTKKCEGPMKHAVRTGLVSGTGFGFSNFLLFCTNALCFYAGARFVHNGTATFGQVFKVSKILCLSLFEIPFGDANHFSQPLLPLFVLFPINRYSYL